MSHSIHRRVSLLMSVCLSLLMFVCVSWCLSCCLAVSKGVLLSRCPSCFYWCLAHCRTVSNDVSLSWLHSLWIDVFSLSLSCLSSYLSLLMSISLTLSKNDGLTVSKDVFLSFCLSLSLSWYLSVSRDVYLAVSLYRQMSPSLVMFVGLYLYLVPFSDCIDVSRQGLQYPMQTDSDMGWTGSGLLSAGF